MYMQMAATGAAELPENGQIVHIVDEGIGQTVAMKVHVTTLDMDVNDFVETVMYSHDNVARYMWSTSFWTDVVLLDSAGTEIDKTKPLSAFASGHPPIIKFILKAPHRLKGGAGAGIPSDASVVVVNRGLTASSQQLMNAMARVETRLQQLLAGLLKEPSVSLSKFGEETKAVLNARAIGYLNLARAAHRGDVFRVLSWKNPTWVPEWDSEAVLSEEEAKNLREKVEECAAPSAERFVYPSAKHNKTRERTITKFMTPHLWHLLHPEIDAMEGPAKSPFSHALVNSEACYWLASTSYGMQRKPDFFDAPWYAVAEEVGSAVQQPDAPDSRFVFGSIRHPIFIAAGAVRMVLEAKVNILTDESFGVLADYCTLLPGMARAIGFDAEHFILYEAFNGNPNFAIEGKWTDRGSKDVIKAFCLDQACTLTKALHDLQRRFELTLHECLGAGAFGIVFRTMDAANQEHALKVVPKLVRDTEDDWTLKSESLFSEHTLMLKAASMHAPVAAMVPDSYYLGDDVCAVLLDTVGYAFEVTTRHDIMCAFAVLLSLHEKKFVHGDARIANLISTIPMTTRVEHDCSSLPMDHHLLWIDMSNMLLTDYSGDAMGLARSILGPVLFAMHKDALPRYLPEHDCAYAFAEAVWEVFRARGSVEA